MPKTSLLQSLERKTGCRGLGRVAASCVAENRAQRAGDVTGGYRLRVLGVLLYRSPDIRFTSEDGLLVLSLSIRFSDFFALYVVYCDASGRCTSRVRGHTLDHCDHCLLGPAPSNAPLALSYQ